MFARRENGSLVAISTGDEGALGAGTLTVITAPRFGETVRIDASAAEALNKTGAQIRVKVEQGQYVITLTFADGSKAFTTLPIGTQP